MIMISLLGKSAQFSDTQAKPTTDTRMAKVLTDTSTFLGMAKVLNQASEDMKIRFFKTSFKSYDENKDGFVTTDEYSKMELEFGSGFDSLINWGMTKALIQFELNREKGIDTTKIGITFDDYQDALEKKLEHIDGKSLICQDCFI